MTAPSSTQTKRRQLFGIILGAVLLPALVALAVPDRSADTEVATVPIAAESAPVETAAPASTTTTEAPTTTTAADTTTVSVASTTKSTTSTTPPTTVAAKQVAYVAPPTTTTTAAPAPPPAPSDGGARTFLACIRQRESGGNYSIVSSNGQWHGAYQFSQSSWNSVAQHAGRTDLVGVAPSQASPADQDAMALALYNWQGKAPWGGYC